MRRQSEAELYSLDDHPDHRAQLGPWCKRWTKVARSTKPMDDANRAAMQVAIAGMYRSRGAEAPRTVFVASPFALWSVLSSRAPHTVWRNWPNVTCPKAESGTRSIVYAAARGA